MRQSRADDLGCMPSWSINNRSTRHLHELRMKCYGNIINSVWAMTVWFPSASLKRCTLRPNEVRCTYPMRYDIFHININININIEEVRSAVSVLVYLNTRTKQQTQHIQSSLSKGAFHLSELTCQTISVVMRNSLLMKAIKPDQSNLK